MKELKALLPLLNYKNPGTRVLKDKFQVRLSVLVLTSSYQVEPIFEVVNRILFLNLDTTSYETLKTTFYTFFTNKHKSTTGKGETKHSVIYTWGPQTFQSTPPKISVPVIPCLREWKH